MKNETKICKACKEEKVVSEFYLRSDTGKHKNRCKRCCIDGVNIPKSSTHKVCKHCNIEKPFDSFQKAGSGGKWLQPYCKDCDKIRKGKWHEENREVVNDKRKVYYIEKIKPFVVKKPRVLMTKEEKLSKRRAYQSTPEFKLRKAEHDRIYRIKNELKLKSKKKQYYKSSNGLERAKAWQKKMMEDVGFRTKKRLRGRIYVALKRGVKSESTMELLGCTIEFFKNYFESLFTDGMSWDVYLKGGIHIDHKIPCKNFDLTNPAEQKKCFHYSNLQPLWELDNLRKGTSLDYELKIT